MSIGPVRLPPALSPGTPAAAPPKHTTHAKPDGTEGFNRLLRVLPRDSAQHGPGGPSISAGLDPTAKPPPPTAPTAAEQSAGIRAMAERALDAEKRVDALIAAAGSGRTFSAAELIALQATVFRYSQTVEVISRATDRLVGAIKQTLGTQV